MTVRKRTEEAKMSGPVFAQPKKFWDRIHGMSDQDR